jgi:hypothetical protein
LSKSTHDLITHRSRRLDFAQEYLVDPVAFWQQEFLLDRLRKNRKKDKRSEQHQMHSALQHSGRAAGQRQCRN